MIINEFFGYYTCACGESFQRISVIGFNEEEVEVYDTDWEETSKLFETHVLKCPVLNPV